MAQIIIDSDVYSIEEVAEEIRLRQETTGMPWHMAIVSVLYSYVVPAELEVKREQSAEIIPKRKRGRPRKNPDTAHEDVQGNSTR